MLAPDPMSFVKFGPSSGDTQVQGPLGRTQSRSLTRWPMLFVVEMVFLAALHKQVCRQLGALMWTKMLCRYSRPTLRLWGQIACAFCSDAFLSRAENLKLGFDVGVDILPSLPWPLHEEYRTPDPPFAFIGNFINSDYVPADAEYHHPIHVKCPQRAYNAYEYRAGTIICNGESSGRGIGGTSDPTGTRR